MLIVGEFLAQSSMASQLRVGPNGEVPEPSAFLGAFSLVACDIGPDCAQLTASRSSPAPTRGYCNAQSFEELYQNFLASPWAYAQAMRYRGIIHTAIDTQNWGLIGLMPPCPSERRSNLRVPRDPPGPRRGYFRRREHAHVLDHAAAQRLGVVAAFERRHDAPLRVALATSTSFSVTQR